MKERYIEFKTRIEADSFKEELKKTIKFNLMGYGWNKKDKHFFEIENLKRIEKEELI